MSVELLILCPGLGHVQRGFETWARQCFAALSTRPELDVTLCKGGGLASERELVLRTIRRDSRLARVGARLGRTSGYQLEQRAFARAARRVISDRANPVVLTSDWRLAKELGRWRREGAVNFALVLCNGGADCGPFDHLDLVLQPRPGLLAEALAAGEPPARHVLLPLGADIEPVLRIASTADVQAIRRRLDLPVERHIVLSVAALNRQKRLDYVIRELSAMGPERPFLMLLGQPDGDTDGIRALADELLGPEEYAMRTVAADAMADYYRAADVFALASLREGFGLVLVEAMAHGLVCVAHDWDAPRFILAEHGALADLTEPGGLRGRLAAALAEAHDPDRRAARHRAVYERFSWDRVADRYVDVLKSPSSSRQPLLAVS